MLGELDGMFLLMVVGIPAFALLSVLAAGVSRRHAPQPRHYEDPRALANRLVREADLSVLLLELEEAEDP